MNFAKSQRIECAKNVVSLTIGIFPLLEDSFFLNRIKLIFVRSAFSDIEHQHSDWYGIHEKICQSLVPLRISLPFLPSEEERKKRDLDLRNKKVSD